MICKKCEAILSEDAKFCPACGAPVEAEPQVDIQPEIVVEPTPQPTPQPVVAPAQPQVKKEVTEKDIPEQYQLMRPWSYFWLNLLYSVPVVGFIFLIIFTFSKGNLNRRNYTRSFWCTWLVGLIIGIVILLIYIILAVLMGVSFYEFSSSVAPTMVY